MLKAARKKTRPRVVDLYDIFCEFFMFKKSGCQWRMLPNEYPGWQLCYYYFSLWNSRDCLDSISILE